MWLFDLFNKEKNEERRKKNIERTAVELFNVTLEKDEFWLCYDGEPIVPMCILVESNEVSEYSALVSEIRKHYVERHLCCDLLKN